MGLGPLLNLTIKLNPQLIVTAFMTTTVIFASFSISALYAQRRSLLYLGGKFIAEFIHRMESCYWFLIQYLCYLYY